MAVDRLLPAPEHVELLDTVRRLTAEELAPIAAKYEAAEEFPRAQFRQLGQLGLLALPYPEQFGGADLPYEVYLQVLEEIAATWASVAVGVSVHVMSCYPVSRFGSDAQRAALLPAMLGGDLLGAYCLSEPHAGSDPAAMRTKATRRDDGSWVLNGTKAWVTHGGVADYYLVFARTGDAESGARGISCFHVAASSAGLSFGRPEHKMGMTSSPTANVIFDDVVVPADALIGGEGQGLTIALSALDSGRLGIAACAVGLSQGALDAAVAYAKERETFGKTIIDHQGLGFLLADMAAAVDSARATMLDAARRRDADRPFGRAASIAKLVATDNAMKVTTDAVQVFGGYGYTREVPVERYMRDAKIMQIFEGTNQIQRLVISRFLARSPLPRTSTP
ncbi:acyl-CoA dehydrogenase family protein [Jatrophihabitans sp. YIM 134969]